MIDLFFSWTDEQRERSLDYLSGRLPNPFITDPHLSFQAANDNIEFEAYCLIHKGLADLLLMWEACNRDLVLTRLCWV